jgi:hypothetical protein
MKGKMRGTEWRQKRESEREKKGCCRVAAYSFKIADVMQDCTVLM